jgi:hypothetical protein
MLPGYSHYQAARANLQKDSMEEENSDSLGLIISIAIGFALLAACGVVAFSLFLVGYLAL